MVTVMVLVTLAMLLRLINCRFIIINAYLLCLPGTPLAGQTDDLRRLHEVCRFHDLWLHLDG